MLWCHCSALLDSALFTAVFVKRWYNYLSMLPSDWVMSSHLSCGCAIFQLIYGYVNKCRSEDWTVRCLVDAEGSSKLMKYANIVMSFSLPLFLPLSLSLCLTVLFSLRRGLMHNGCESLNKLWSLTAIPTGALSYTNAPMSTHTRIHSRLRVNPLNPWLFVTMEMRVRSHWPLVKQVDQPE